MPGQTIRYGRRVESDSCFSLTCDCTCMNVFIRTLQCVTMANLSFIIIFLSSYMQPYDLTEVDLPLNSIKLNQYNLTPYIENLTDNIIIDNNVNGFDSNYFISDYCNKNILYLNQTDILKNIEQFKYLEINTGFPDIYNKPIQKCVDINIKVNEIPMRRSKLAIYSARIAYILSMINIFNALVYFYIIYNKQKQNQSNNT
jgi:hypothetical protein